MSNKGHMPSDNRWKPIAGSSDPSEVWVGHDPSSRFPVYTRGNAGEVYPAVITPLSFSIAADQTERAMRAAVEHAGLIRPNELVNVPLSTGAGGGAFGGYGYLNLSIQRMAAARMPGGKASDADVNFLGVGEPPPHTPMPGERNWRASVAGLSHLVGLMRRTSLPELDEDQRAVDRHLASLPGTDIDDTALWEVCDALYDDLLHPLFERHLKVSTDAGLAIAALTNLCERLLGDATITVQLLAGLGGIDSAAPSVALWRLSRLANASPQVTDAFDHGTSGLADRLSDIAEAADFVNEFEAFLSEFGSRGPNEWETGFDTWGTAPELALSLIDRLRTADDSHDPVPRQQQLERDRQALEQTVLARLNPVSRRMFSGVLRAARLLSRGRERSKTTVVRGIHGSRVRMMELDRRLAERSGGERGDMWFVTRDELDAYIADPGSFGTIIGQRRATHDRLAERFPPFFFSGSQPPLDQWELRTAELPSVRVGDAIEGLPGCHGVAQGRARIVADPSDPRALQPGEILVAPLTDPSWTPLFLAADGVVVDVGAVMSHAVIVSRELGIPCAVSVTGATRRIPNGAMIEVNGTTGVVTVIDLPPD